MQGLDFNRTNADDKVTCRDELARLAAVLFSR
jgi:hypothetical protein